MAELLGQYGYAILFAAVFFMNAGLPVPGHGAYVAAALMSGRGTMDLTVVMLGSAVASVTGSAAGFFIGRRGGRRFVERHGPKVRLTAARLGLLDRFFARWGVWAVLLTRFFVVVRTFGALFAGISRVPPSRFLPATLAGAVLWATAYGLAGGLVGDRLQAVDDWLLWIGFGVGALFPLVMGLGVLWRRRRQRRAGVVARSAEVE